MCKKMTDDEKKRLIDICYRSKSGSYVSSEDYMFCEKMLTKFPDEYYGYHKQGTDRAIAEVNPLYKG